MNFIPALKYHWATPYYDWFIRNTMPERWVKLKTVALANIKKTDKVLDFGCGTGTLILLLYPYSENIEGFDIDEKIIAISKKKFEKENMDIKIIKDFSDITSNAYDKIVSTWVFHHLTFEEKVKAMQEIKRILKPNGLFVLSDWGKPQNFLMSFCFFILQIFDNFTTTNDNKLGKIPEILMQTEFQNIKEIENKSTLLGTVTFWTANKQKQL